MALDFSSPNTLSAVYQDILRGDSAGIKLALSMRARTAEEEAMYQKAVQFLYRVNPDGSWSDSPATIAYKQYRDQWFAAQEVYKNKQIEAAFTSDAAIKESWTSLEEPALRSQIGDLESE